MYRLYRLRVGIVRWGVPWVGRVLVHAAAARVGDLCTFMYAHTHLLIVHRMFHRLSALKAPKPQLLILLGEDRLPATFLLVTNLPCLVRIHSGRGTQDTGDGFTHRVVWLARG